MDPAVAMEPVAMDPVALELLALDPVAMDPVALDPVAMPTTTDLHLAMATHLSTAMPTDIHLGLATATLLPTVTVTAGEEQSMVLEVCMFKMNVIQKFLST